MEKLRQIAFRTRLLSDLEVASPFSGISRLATVGREENGIQPDNEKVNWMPSTKLKPDTSASNKSRKKASKAVGKSFSEKFETACDCKFLFSLLTEICADRQMLQPEGAAPPRELYHFIC